MKANIYLYDIDKNTSESRVGPMLRNLKNPMVKKKKKVFVYV